MDEKKMPFEDLYPIKNRPNFFLLEGEDMGSLTLEVNTTPLALGCSLSWSYVEMVKQVEPIGLTHITRNFWWSGLIFSSCKKIPTADTPPRLTRGLKPGGTGLARRSLFFNLFFPHTIHIIFWLFYWCLCNIGELFFWDYVINYIYALYMLSC